MSDDDCEDQALVYTSVCLKFSCQDWKNRTLQRPKLILRGKYWWCPKCMASYGEHAVDDWYENVRV